MPLLTSKQFRMWRFPALFGLFLAGYGIWFYNRQAYWAEDFAKVREQRELEEGPRDREFKKNLQKVYEEAKHKN